jgi:hypothetical protein
MSGWPTEKHGMPKSNPRLRDPPPVGLPPGDGLRYCATMSLQPAAPVRHGGFSCHRLRTVTVHRTQECQANTAPATGLPVQPLYQPHCLQRYREQHVGARACS